MTELINIKKFVVEHNLDYSHYTLARFLKNSMHQATEFCLWLSVLVNVEIGRGNVCLDISSILLKSRELGWTNLPSSNELLRLVKQSPLVGLADQNKPLIMDNNRLYLNRYFHNEKKISESLLTLAGDPVQDIQCPVSILDNINKLFSVSTLDDQQLDYQKLAAIISISHQLSIISGGPGTGKTWTVCKILALLIQQNPAIKIKLAAPTGKAAARLSESIQSLRQHLDIDESVQQKIPVEAVTLHRLLAIHRFTHRPHFDKHNLLICDVLVVDEASMIDQQMMAAICSALPAQCKLILLGDKDQLSSVEAGSVFADLCGGHQQTVFKDRQQAWLKQTLGYEIAVEQTDFALANHVVVLQKSHRFDEFSGIGQLAKTVNMGDSRNSINILKTADLLSQIRWFQPLEHELAGWLKQQAGKTYLDMMRAESIQQAFQLFNQYQILSAVWNGPTGVDNINSLIESNLKSRQGLSKNMEFYQGKPLMMTSNVYQYDIHNGDIGIIWPDEQGKLKLWFEQSAGEYRYLSLSQCPYHKTAYAMTVHKSQGSEFKRVLLILPYFETQVSTRELFYTGLTRASESVEIWGNENSIKFAIEQKTERVSGLMQRLYTA